MPQALVVTGAPAAAASRLKRPVQMTESGLDTVALASYLRLPEVESLSWACRNNNTARFSSRRGFSLYVPCLLHIDRLIPP